MCFCCWSLTGLRGENGFGEIVPSGKMQSSEFLEGTGVGRVLLAGRLSGGELQVLQGRRDELACPCRWYTEQEFYLSLPG